ncbi:MAG: thiamine pyrophosphate-dependent enzyme [Halioglobus sp.]
MSLDKAQFLRAYRTMRTIRDFEYRVSDEFGKGNIPGFLHLYAGQEAIATGMCMNLDDDDYIVSTHRGHGHCIAKGGDVGDMMKEIMAKQAAVAPARAAPCTSPPWRRGCSGPMPLSAAARR